MAGSVNSIRDSDRGVCDVKVTRVKMEYLIGQYNQTKTLEEGGAAGVRTESTLENLIMSFGSRRSLFLFLLFRESLERKSDTAACEQAAHFLT